jgi:glycyl-tRNA synthetase
MSGMLSEKEEFQKELTAFIQEQGFVWGPEPEIYGGLAGFYTYGPMGKLLKNKIEASVRRVFQSNGFWELEGPTISPKEVWEGSGHWSTFVDKIVKCKKCLSVFRVDKLIEEKLDVDTAGMKSNDLLKYIKKLKCPSCSGEFVEKIEEESLMMKTSVGGRECGLRPETATVTYLPYKRFYDFFRKRLPLGVFQIGKAYRNEISPRQGVLRGREFTQAEGQLFVDPKEKNDWDKFESIKKIKLPFLSYSSSNLEFITPEDAIKKKYIKSKVYAWCLWLAYDQFVSMGVPADKIRLRQHYPDEKAFYADDAWDVEIHLKAYGWFEVCGVHDRTDYDLTQHEKNSKVELSAIRENGEKFRPHVLEIAFGTDRPTFALLDLFYEKKGKEEGKTLFKLPYHMSPVDVAVLPLMKKNELVNKSLEIKNLLEKDFVINYDVSGSIGKRYLRNAIVGTPYCVTIDYDSVEKDIVTIRDRDTEKQRKVKVTDLRSSLLKLFSGFNFEKIGLAVK